MKQYLFLLFCCLVSNIVICQKNDFIWLSGAYNIADDTATNFILDFNFSPPKIEKAESKIDMSYANICMSDSNGILQYYTNGCIVRAKNHIVMENGDYINEGIASTIYSNNCGPNGLGLYPVFQGIFALPFDNNIYGLFHTRMEADPAGPNGVCLYGALLYSQIDMNANQGLGRVVFKDSILLEGCLQTSSANRHANGRDWWVLLPDNVNNRFYRFLSTPEGIQGPWTQEIENPTIVDTFFYLGWSEFSPNGERFLINDIHSGTVIYDFDRCTGLLSNLRHLPGNLDSYGWAAAFSPDSRFIYVVKGNFTTIEQFDLEEPDILSSQITVAVWDTFYYFQPGGGPRQTFFSYFQHGPDGKLYDWAGDTKYMHIMNYPNRKGEKCKFQQRAIELPYYTFGANAYYPNYRLGPIDGSSCDTLGINNNPVALFRYEVEDTLSPLQVTFTDLSYYEPTTWHWGFGDGMTSQDTSPMHLFQNAGTYNVCLTVSNANGADTFCQLVKVGVVSIHDLPVLPLARVSPNPFGSWVTVSLPVLLQEKPRFVLFDVFGREATSVCLTDFETHIDLPGLPSGLYVWQLCFRNVLVQTGKIIKTD